MRLAHNAIAEGNSQKPKNKGIPVVFNTAPSGFVGQNSNSLADCYGLTALLIGNRLISNEHKNLNEVGRKALPFSFLNGPFLLNQRKY